MLSFNSSHFKNKVGLLLSWLLHLEDTVGFKTTVYTLDHNRVN